MDYESHSFNYEFNATILNPIHMLPNRTFLYSLRYLLVSKISITKYLKLILHLLFILIRISIIIFHVAFHSILCSYCFSLLLSLHFYLNIMISFSFQLKDTYAMVIIKYSIAQSHHVLIILVNFFIQAD
jgi:hypothetical protein